MFIISPGMVKYMSTVIAVCGTDFCMLASDSRKVVPDENGNWVIESDDCQKIFKINDNVLFGAVGEFWKSEDIDAPFHGINDLPRFSMYQCNKLIERYIAENMAKTLYFPRRYFLVGREFDGNFCIVSYIPNLGKHGFDIDVKRSPAQQYKATLMALPHSLGEQALKAEYESLLINAVSSAYSIDEMQVNLSKLITKIGDADTDHTVGGSFRCYTIV